MSENGEVAGVVLGLTGAVMGVWGLMTPPIHEVRSSDTSPTLARDVHHAEATAGALTVAGGVVASYALKSPWPTIIATAVVGFMVWQLEQGLNTPGSGG